MTTILCSDCLCEIGQRPGARLMAFGGLCDVCHERLKAEAREGPAYAAAEEQRMRRSPRLGGGPVFLLRRSA
jgi:hypothetical protein